MRHSLFEQLYSRSKASGFVILLALLFVFNNQLYAGGRPVGRKRVYLIPSVAYFLNNKFWDANGNKQTYADNGKFSSLILSLNSEYGFSRRVSLVGRLPYLIDNFNQGGISRTVAGLGDASVGVRYYFANINYNIYFSIQGSVTMPLYKNTINKSLGYEKLGPEIAFLSSGDFGIGSQKFYYEFEGGVKRYIGEPGPMQYKYSGSISYIIDRKNQVSIGETGLFSSSTDKTFNPTDLIVNQDFSFQQVTAGYSYSIQRNKSIFVSASKFISGKNTGIGSTLSLGYVYKY